MRYALCIAGWIFALAAVAAAGWALAVAGPGGIFQRPLGELWFKLDAGSLNLVQAVIERYIWPPLWEFVASPILRTPAVVAFAAPAALFLVLCFLRRLRRR